MDQFVYQTEMYLNGFFATAPFLITFIAGVLSFLSPCVLPMIPAYLSYITGLSINQLSHQEKLDLFARVKVLLHAVMFVIGFGLVFVLLGILSDTIFTDVMKSPFVQIIGGLVIVVLGLNILHFFNIKFLNFQSQSNFGGGKGFLAPFLLGVSFAAGWTPCVGPILGSVFMLSSQEDGRAAILMAVYALGLGIPFILAAILTTSAISLMNKIKKHMEIVEKVSGVLLLLIGGYIIYSGVVN